MENSSNLMIFLHGLFVKGCDRLLFMDFRTGSIWQI